MGKIFELESSDIKSSDLLIHRCIGYRCKRVSVPSLSGGHVRRVRAVGWRSCAGVQEVRAVSWAAYGRTGEQREGESRWESRESKFPRTATGIFTWASIQARSIARVLWLKGKGRGEREGEKTKFSMALTSGTRGEILILIWWRKRTIFVGFLVMG